MIDPNEMPQLFLALLLLAVTLFALVIGLLVACKNGWVAVQKMRRRKTGHIVPVVGGVMLFFGAFFSPLYDFRPWALLALFLDVGSVPYLLYSAVALFRKKARHE